MIKIKFDGIHLICDKCENLIRLSNYWMPKKSIEKYKRKKIFCGRCIQKRLHRNDPNWVYEKEFFCEPYKSKNVSDSIEKFLNMISW